MRDSEGLRAPPVGLVQPVCGQQAIAEPSKAGHPDDELLAAARAAVDWIPCAAEARRLERAIAASERLRSEAAGSIRATFSIRTQRVLMGLGARFLWDLSGLTERQIMFAPEAGRKTLLEIRRVMAAHGLRFAGDAA